MGAEKIAAAFAWMVLIAGFVPTVHSMYPAGDAGYYGGYVGYYYYAYDPTYTDGPPTYPAVDFPVSDTTGRRLSEANEELSLCSNCGFDSDWQAWAVALPRCRSALYALCDRRPGMVQCSWLDEYFQPDQASGFRKNHETEISDFLFSQCPPSSPCACSNLQFVPTDDSRVVQTCCEQLRTWCQVPGADLKCNVVHSYCATGHRRTDIRNWVAQRSNGWTCDRPSLIDEVVSRSAAESSIRPKFQAQAKGAAREVRRRLAKAEKNIITDMDSLLRSKQYSSIIVAFAFVMGGVLGVAAWQAKKMIQGA